jgi:hypothetical protein
MLQDVHRIGTLLELMRELAFTFANDGKRVRVGETFCLSLEWIQWNHQLIQIVAANNSFASTDEEEIWDFVAWNSGMNER